VAHVSVDREPTVDNNLLTGQEPRRVRSQENDGVSNLLGKTDTAESNAVAVCVADLVVPRNRV